MALRGSQYSASYKKRLEAGLDVVLRFLRQSGQPLGRRVHHTERLDTWLERFVNWLFRAPWQAAAECGQACHLSCATSFPSAPQAPLPDMAEHSSLGGPR